jgi:ankyrin repeat protein
MLSTHPTIDPIELFAIALESGYEEIIKKLLEKHQLSTLEGLNKDSLSKAAKAGNTEIFKLLLKHQSIPINHNACNAALYEAVIRENETLVQLLLTIPNIHIHKKNAREKTPFCLAIEMNNIPITQLLYNHTNNIINEYFLDGNTPLICAAKQKNIDLINFLIDICKANLSSKDDYDATFFHHLVMPDATFSLEQLTFFKNYNDEQKKQFINEQLQSFVHIKFLDQAKENIHRITYDFINYCKKCSGDLNQRPNKYDRPVDTADKVYAALVQHLNHSSAQFIIKEKIYHTFLIQTNAIPEHELYYRLNERYISDIKNIIMRYYCAVTIDKKIAFLIITKPDKYGSYYEKNNELKCSSFYCIECHRPRCCHHSTTCFRSAIDRFFCFEE